MSAETYPLPEMSPLAALTAEVTGPETARRILVGLRARGYELTPVSAAAASLNARLSTDAVQVLPAPQRGPQPPEQPILDGENPYEMFYPQNGVGRCAYTDTYGRCRFTAGHWTAHLTGDPDNAGYMRFRKANPVIPVRKDMNPNLKRILDSAEASRAWTWGEPTEFIESNGANLVKASSLQVVPTSNRIPTQTVYRREGASTNAKWHRGLDGHLACNQDRIPLTDCHYASRYTCDNLCKRCFPDAQRTP